MMEGRDYHDLFVGFRPKLIRLAYRMLGSVTDAEDVVQDAYLRWLKMDIDAVREPGAVLRTIVTRLCINELSCARRTRETYLGPWLPEPIFNDENEEGLIDDITLPLMMALERLSPLERAAFLLHDVFGMSFDDVAAAVEREAAACRKLASRARVHIHAARPRFPTTGEHGLKIAEAFFAASRHGDMEKLRALLTDDVVAYADGGGKVSASTCPLIGLDAVVKRHVQLVREFTQWPSSLVRYAVIDGLPGFITVERKGILQTTALQIAEEKICAIFCVRNPEKLRHVGGISVQ